VRFTPLPTLAALLLLSATPSKAELPWSTGNTLFKIIACDIQAHDFNSKLTQAQTNSVCLMLGYFRGFAECSALAAHYDATALPFYLPDTVTNDELERVVAKYLSDNPDKLDLKGDVLIVAALSRAFPNTAFKAPSTPAPSAKH